MPKRPKKPLPGEIDTTPDEDIALPNYITAIGNSVSTQPPPKPFRERTFLQRLGDNLIGNFRSPEMENDRFARDYYLAQLENAKTAIQEQGKLIGELMKQQSPETRVWLRQQMADLKKKKLDNKILQPKAALAEDEVNLELQRKKAGLKKDVADADKATTDAETAKKYAPVFLKGEKIGNKKKRADAAISTATANVYPEFLGLQQDILGNQASRGEIENRVLSKTPIWYNEDLFTLPATDSTGLFYIKSNEQGEGAPKITPLGAETIFNGIGGTIRRKPALVPAPTPAPAPAPAPAPLQQFNESLIVPQIPLQPEKVILPSGIVIQTPEQGLLPIQRPKPTTQKDTTEMGKLFENLKWLAENAYGSVVPK